MKRQALDDSMDSHAGGGRAAQWAEQNYDNTANVEHGTNSVV